jgi:GT2 family glycosyltransferase
MLESAYSGAVVYVRTAPEGVQQARNAGLAVAKGEWIATLDDDDLWHPNFIESARNAAEDGRANIIYSDHRKFDQLPDGRSPFPRTNFENAPAGYWENVPRGDSYGGCSFVGSFPIELLLRFIPFYPSAMVARRDLVERIGGWNPRVRGIKSEDIEFLTRALLQGQLAVVWEPLVDYRVHGSNSCGGDAVAQALGRWRIFEFIYAQDAYGSERLRAALERDLPRRRANAFDRAWRDSRFAVADELSPLLRREDWTVARRLRRVVRRSPEPIRSAVMSLRRVWPGAIMRQAKNFAASDRQ